MRRLTHKLTHAKLQHRGSSSKSARDKLEGTKLTNFRERAKGAGVRLTPSRDRSTGRHHCAFVELFSHQQSPAHVGTKSEVSFNLTPLAPPWWFPETCPTQFANLAQASSSGFPKQVALPQLILQNFPKVHIPQTSRSQLDYAWISC